MDVKNTHSFTKTKISVFGRQALDAERRRSPSLADKVLNMPLSLSRATIFRRQKNPRRVYRPKIAGILFVCNEPEGKYYTVPKQSSVMGGPRKIRSRGSWSQIVPKATDA